MKKLFSKSVCIIMCLMMTCALLPIVPVYAETNIFDPNNINTIIYGDVNGDKAINAKDSLLLRKYIADYEVTIKQTNSDVNEDGSFTSKDSIQIREYIAGITQSVMQLSIFVDSVCEDYFNCHGTDANNNYVRYKIYYTSDETYRAQEYLAFGYNKKLVTEKYTEIIAITITKEALAEKPVIYLYPEKPTDVSVTLDFNGDLLLTEPTYNGVWNVTAYPDGTLVDANGNSYPYLFWEGKPNYELEITKGFCIAGEDTEAFLRDTLIKIGLIQSEYEEFIDFWLPLMQNNKYNLIQFQAESYTDNAKLTISPEPDSMLRVFMTYSESDNYVGLPSQTLTSFTREGFCVVEWGGCELK